MPISDITSDPATLTMTMVGDYPVPVARLWQAYADPRQIERFWGPPEWPATFTRHDLAVGGRSEYHMTGPDGERSGGYWEYLAVDEHKRIEVRDGFADADGKANPEMPSMHMLMTFESTDDGSRITTVTTFPDAATMEQLVEMGMVEGATAAMAQLDDVVADLRAWSAGDGTTVELLGETRIRVARVVRGTVAQVWDAHHDPEVLTRWMLGPDGWTMPVCDIAAEVGDAYRYEWESDDGDGRFGFEGEVLERQAPWREVATERPADSDEPGTVNELTLVPADGGTLLVVVITCPSTEVRDMVLASGMDQGLEPTYARLDAVLAA